MLLRHECLRRISASRIFTAAFWPPVHQTVNLAYQIKCCYHCDTNGANMAVAFATPEVQKHETPSIASSAQAKPTGDRRLRPV